MLSRQESFRHMKKQTDKAQMSIIETAVCKFKSTDFENYIWSRDYIVRGDDFLYYDRNC